MKLSQNTQIHKQNIVFSIFLTIITFGIYSFFWKYILLKNTKAIKNDGSSCAREMLCLLFVPFYSLYWWFTRGQTVKDNFTELGYSAIGGGIAYLILDFFELDIISLAIMQHNFNKLPFNAVEPIQKSIKKKKEFLGTLSLTKLRIGKCMLLSFITLGIFQIYWKCLLVKNIKTLKNDESGYLGEIFIS